MRRFAGRSVTASIVAVLGAPVSAGAAEAVVVRASWAVAHCVESAAAAHGSLGNPATVTAAAVPYRAGTARADVIVTLGSAEHTRAVESGAAVEGSEVAIARVPWVLAVKGGNPLGIRGLRDLRDLEVWTAALPAANEARLALRGSAAAKLRESADRRLLDQADIALVPLTLAGPGERIAADLPPLEVVAAVATSASNPEAARAFLTFLASEAGQRAFAECKARR